MLRETSISKGQRLRKNGNVLRENQHLGLSSSETHVNAQAPQQREAEDGGGRGSSGLVHCLPEAPGGEGDGQHVHADTPQGWEAKWQTVTERLKSKTECRQPCVLGKQKSNLVQGWPGQWGQGRNWSDFSRIETPSDHLSPWRGQSSPLPLNARGIEVLLGGKWRPPRLLLFSNPISCIS